MNKSTGVTPGNALGEYPIAGGGITKARIDKITKQRDALKSTMRKIVDALGFTENDVPNGAQILVRLKERLQQCNDKHSPLASQKPTPYVPSHPAYSPNRAPPRPPKPPVPKPVVEFEISHRRFGQALYNDTWSQLQKHFPAPIGLEAGTHFLGDRNVPFRIVGYLPSKPTFGVAVCAAWMLEDPNYIFTKGDLFTYRTDWVVRKLGGMDATRALEEARIKKYATRYGVFPQATSEAGFELVLGGCMRTVRLVDINPKQRKRPITVEEVSSHSSHRKRWDISTSALHGARPNTDAFASVDVD